MLMVFSRGGPGPSKANPKALGFRDLGFKVWDLGLGLKSCFAAAMRMSASWRVRSTWGERVGTDSKGFCKAKPKTLNLQA